MTIGNILNRWVEHFDHILNREGEDIEQADVESGEVYEIADSDI